jgi:hypothetical protein
VKFHQLQVGSRFRLGGELYIKSKPLVATHLGSKQDRLIRRSAMVEPEDGGPAPVAAQERTPGLAAVDAALADYHRRCQACLEQIRGELPQERLEQMEAQMERAWAELRQDLDLPPAEVV